MSEKNQPLKDAKQLGRQLANQLFDDVRAETPKDLVDESIGAAIAVLVEKKANMIARRADLERDFMKDRDSEFKAFLISRGGE